MYLKKQTKINVQGSIDWLEQQIKDGVDPKLKPVIVVEFLKSILENK